MDSNEIIRALVESDPTLQIETMLNGEKSRFWGIVRKVIERLLDDEESELDNGDARDSVRMAKAQKGKALLREVLAIPAKVIAEAQTKL